MCVARPTILENVGIADTFARTAKDPETLMDAFGLAVDDVVAAAKRALARKK
jgi:transketolase C-terminal domain/subunit